MKTGAAWYGWMVPAHVDVIQRVELTLLLGCGGECVTGSVGGRVRKGVLSAEVAMLFAFQLAREREISLTGENQSHLEGIGN